MTGTLQDSVGPNLMPSRLAATPAALSRDSTSRRLANSLRKLHCWLLGLRPTTAQRSTAPVAVSGVSLAANAFIVGEESGRSVPRSEIDLHVVAFGFWHKELLPYNGEMLQDLKCSSPLGFFKNCPFHLWDRPQAQVFPRQWPAGLPGRIDLPLNRGNIAHSPPRFSSVAPGTFCPFMSHTDECAGHPDFDSLVELYYRSLYQFAFSLTQSESDACDLTQQTFYIWATKGNQLRDPSKVKSWLFTTLHREFLESRRRQSRFPHYELSQVDSELPMVSPVRVNQLDAAEIVQALRQVDAVYQAPVALFYLEDYAYKEIADILGIPMGTVKSRIARGIAQLQKALVDKTSADSARKEKQ